MKKLVALFLLFILAFTALTACSPDDEPSGNPPLGDNSDGDTSTIPGNADPMMPDPEWSEGLLG